MNVPLLHGSAIWRPSEDTSGRDVKFLDFLAEPFISNESVNDNSTKELMFPSLSFDFYYVKNYADTRRGYRETIQVWAWLQMKEQTHECASLLITMAARFMKFLVNNSRILMRKFGHM